MAAVLDGKATAVKVKNSVASKVADYIAHGGRVPSLAVILAGENPASQVYVRNKKKDCEEVGILSSVYVLPADTSKKELLDLVSFLNSDPETDGILCQLPLPRREDENEVLEAILPDKDVDCFHPYSAGRLFQGNPLMLPCTPAGIIRLLDEYGIQIEGKRCCVVGRSNIVGKPAAMLLLSRSGTVTVCHSRTPDLASHTRSADILVCAVGKAGIITGDMVKPGAAVIDVGMNRGADGKLCGDCDFDSCSGVAEWITPVPGGVGPMTRAMLLENTLTAYRIHEGIV